jgi:ABC-type Fe3+-siderophore transport system permease subunit
MKTAFTFIAVGVFTATVIISYFVYCLWWAGKKIDEERKK